MLRTTPIAVLLLACTGEPTPTGPEAFVFPANTADAVSNYAAIVEATYADTLAGAEALDAAVGAFVAAPSDTTLADARDAWRASRVPYLQTEVFRFYEGPIDDPETGPEGLLNAWPLDEHYIDYVEGDPDTGIVNGTEPLDGATLEALNEVGGEKNIATGYHAVEFLLWGQDHSDTGPGDRPYTDYVTDGSGTAANQQRRADYLVVTSGLIADHIGAVHDAWAPGATYRTSFEGDPEASFARILTGMIILSGFETGGERLQAALDSGDREDEHSCFSDNTKVDMVEDVRGIRNVWHGTYGTVTGVGIVDVVTEVDADLASTITARIDESLALAEALQDPFENEIVPTNADGNARVQALIDSLRTQEDLLSQVFTTFELTIPSAE
ncbi:MAG: iron-regulated protein [Alphaproteobacteria bacterium]|nr:iron-regulated protein [Alphaproteobacteria bacterium]